MRGKEMLDVSIIIPVYNAKRYLDKCLGSVLNQTFTNFEVIVIDDNSTDETNEMASLWAAKDDRVRLLKNVGKGVSSARNYGLKNAKGRFVAFLDVDDTMSPIMIETMVKIREENECQCVVVSYTSDYRELSPKNDPSDAILIKSPETYNLLTRNEKDVGGYVWNKLYDRNIIEKNSLQFDSEVASGEDLLFNFQYFKYVKNIVYCRRKLYYYRLSENSAVNRLDNPRWFDIIHSYEKIMGSGVSPDILEYFSYDFVQLILEAIYRTKYCKAGKYTYKELLPLKRTYAKLNPKWGVKKNIKLILFLLSPGLSMRYKRKDIKS